MSSANFQNMPAGAAAPQAGQRLNSQQIQQMIIQSLKRHHNPQGWQASVQVEERAIKVLNLVGSLRLIKPDMDARNSVHVAISYEQKAFDECTDKAGYDTRLSEKLLHIKNSRQKHHQDLQNAHRNAQNAQALQMSLMPQHHFQSPMSGQGQFQQGFPHQLQQQMQASQLPMQQQQQMQRALAQNQQASNSIASGQVQGQAPQAPMIPPGMPTQAMQMGQQMLQQRQGIPPNFAPKQPTAQDIQAMRSRLPAHAQTMTDDQVRALIIQQTRNLFARQAQQQQHIQQNNQQQQQQQQIQQNLQQQQQQQRQQQQQQIQQNQLHQSQQQVSHQTALRQSQQQIPIAMENQSSQNSTQQPQQFQSVQRPSPQVQPVREMLTPQENQQVNMEARILAENTPKEDLAKIRANLQKMSPQQREALDKQGIDPLLYFFRNAALKNFRAKKAQAQFAAQQQRQQQSQGTGPMSGVMPGQQRPMAQPSISGANQQGGDQFRGGVGDIIEQQADAIRSQEAGQLVVPVSNNQRIAQQQGSTFPVQVAQLQQGQQGQGGLGRSIPTTNPAQQQQFLHTQQVQQERMREAAKAQAQSQTQAQQQQQLQNTQAHIKAQQLGMNNHAGQRPTQQSPAMPVLNQPLRTPGQQAQQQQQQHQQGAQRTQQQRPQQGLTGSGQPQPDPRFSQASVQQAQQRAQGVGPMGNSKITTPAQRIQMIPANVPLSLRQQLLQMPEPEFRQILAKISMQSAQQQDTRAFQNLQAPRPPVVNGPAGITSQVQQLGTNMIPQGLPPHQSTPMGGFMIPANSNFAPRSTSMPQPATGAITEQQALNQQRHELIQQPMTPDRMREMDAINFPRNILNANNNKLASQVPEQVKSWGQLKDWVARNPQHMTQGSLLKLQALQGIHSQQLKTLQLNKPGVRLNTQQQNPPAQTNPPPVTTEMTMPPANAARGVRLGSQARATAPQQQQQVPTPQNQLKGVKRASSDDVVEVPNPNQQQPQQQHVVNMGQNQPPNRPGAMRFTAEQIAALPPHQRAQLEARLNAVRETAKNSEAAPQISESLPREPKQEQAARLKEIAKEEFENAPERPIIDMTPDMKQIMKEKLRELPEMLDRLEKSLPVFFGMTTREDVVRQLIQTRMLLLQQFHGNKFQPKDAFSISPEELDQAKDRLKKYFQFVILMVRQQGVKQQARPGQNQEQNAVQPDGRQSTDDQSHPLTGANLQQHQQAFRAAREQTMQKQGRNPVPPAAPTTSQPPFSLGASSPQGVPQAYGPKVPFNMDAMKLPPPKRRKGNQPGNDSAVSTPVQQKTTPGSSSSPRANKLTLSPQTKKQQATDGARAAPDLSNPYKCSTRECGFHVKGFASQAELAKHKADVHEPKQPSIDDPLGFCLEAMAEGLGLTKEGTRKVSTETANATNASPMKAGQTPKVKQETTPSGSAGTPLARAPTQTSNTGGKQSSSPVSNLLKTPQLGVTKTPTPGSGMIGGGRGPTSQPVNGSGEKLSSEIQASAGEVASGAQSTMWGESNISPQTLLQCFEGLEKVQGFPSFSNIRSTTPAFTPSSKGTVSSRSSDISENDALSINISGGFDTAWNPFGLYDEALNVDFEGMGVGGLEGKGRGDAFEMDWDRTFGENSGLEAPDDDAFVIHGGFDTSLFSMQA